MTSQPMKINVIEGHIAFTEPAFGVSRMTEYDKDGKVIREIDTHAVCIGYDGICMVCGRKME